MLNQADERVDHGCASARHGDIRNGGSLENRGIVSFFKFFDDILRKLFTDSSKIWIQIGIINELFFIIFVQVKNFPAFIIVDDKGNDFFATWSDTNFRQLFINFRTKKNLTI